MIWAPRWSVALRTFYRQILSVLYSSFPFGNFRPRLLGHYWYRGCFLMSHSDLDGRILACTLAALMCSPQLSLISLLLTCHCLSFHLNAVEAPDPKGASGREWCYVEPQAGSGKVWGRFRTTFRTTFRNTGSRKVPGQVPNHGFQETSRGSSEPRI